MSPGYAVYAGGWRSVNDQSECQSGETFTTTAPAIVVNLWTQYQATAQAALDKSDITVIRCASAGVAVPSAWQTYRSALRAIVTAATGTPGTLPSVPPYPTGT